jgi:hypothetical protein
MNALRVLLIVLLLSACASPILTAGINIGPGGVSVVPAVSGKLGGATVRVSP